MATADVDSDGYDEIVFCPCYSPIDKDGRDMQADLHVLKFVNTTPPQLTEVSTSPLGSRGTDYMGYGACGIAIADVVGNDGVPEIIVTTLAGEVFVFSQSNGVITQTLHQRILDGGVGAFSSIFVANLDPTGGNTKPQLYLATTAGIRRFDFP